MHNIKITPVILAGGSGKRLWPLSNNDSPKQFLKFNNKFSLFQQSLLRVLSKKDYINPIVVINKSHQNIALKQMSEINVIDTSIIIEPVSRNTAPAIALAAFHSNKFNNNDSLLLIMPSDHIINNPKELLNTLDQIKNGKIHDKIITFGLPTKSCNTQYGYIKAGKKLNEFLFEVTRFDEKPKNELVNKFIQDQKYYWNSGIYLIKPTTYLKELKKFSPNTYKFTKKSYINCKNEENSIYVNTKYFELAENISIDKCIMERTNLGATVPVNLECQDIGSWERVFQSSKKDISNNAINGKVFSQDTKNCLINAEDGLVATVGLNNHIVVKNKDNVLVASKNCINQASQFISSLKNTNGINATFFGSKVSRNWGHYEVFIKQANFQIKQLVIAPGKKISL